MRTLSWMLIILIVYGFYGINSSNLPNILFILIDDLGWNDISYHNGCDYPTPNIDNLASTSLKLNNYYIQHICTPTRSALLSGLYPIKTGLQDGVIQTIAPYGLPLQFTLLPQDLKRAGYSTHIIGSVILYFIYIQFMMTINQ